MQAIRRGGTRGSAKLWPSYAGDRATRLHHGRGGEGVVCVDGRSTIPTYVHVGGEFLERRAKNQLSRYPVKVFQPDAITVARTVSTPLLLSI